MQACGSQSRSAQLKCLQQDGEGSTGLPGEELTTSSRAAAIIALVLAALTVATAVYSAIANFPRGLILAMLLIGAALGAWYGLLRRGLARVVGLGLAALLALAAVLIVGISLYHGNSDGPGKLNPGLGNGQFRSGSIHLVSPIADQKSAPAEFHWDAVQGASSYTVELKDVAGITLESAKSSENVLPVTPEMKACMVSGKPLKWKVTAMDANGKEIANSSLEQFKVK